MKLAIVYDPKCPKLTPKSYSWTYYDMFLALIERFEEVQEITESCSAKDIDADVIIFYDIHSSQDITIDGIKNHPAVVYDYFNDPHQKEFTGVYPNGLKVHKLSAKQRADRAMERGAFIICPYLKGYYEHIAPHIDNADDRFVWFPVAPRPRKIKILPLKDRKQQVLANGHLWAGEDGFKPYEFRNWAFRQKEVRYVPHSIYESVVPRGNSYQTFLSMYAGALALCDTYVVPKYLEIPLAGSLCFAQCHEEYKTMGFKDGESCIYVDKNNFNQKIRDFLSSPKDYQQIAEKGRQVALNWTAEKFADYIYDHASKCISACSQRAEVS